MPAHGSNPEAFTPEWIFKGLRTRFDLDPCAPGEPCPSMVYCNAWYALARGQDGLLLPWFGLVWLNPPWTRGEKVKWVGKLAHHGDGIALVRGGVDSAWLHLFPPDALWLLRGRVKYLTPAGVTLPVRKGGATGPFEPSMLIAYGTLATAILRNAELPGFFARREPA